MKQAGIYLMIGAIGSILLNQFGYEFVLLMWIDSWGQTVGWAIRGAAIAAGAVLFFLGNRKDSQEAELATDQEA